MPEFDSLIFVLFQIDRMKKFDSRGFAKIDNNAVKAKKSFKIVYFTKKLHLES